MAYKGPQEVTGPASSTDNTIPRFDGTGGDFVQTSGVSITDADICNGITQLNVDNLRLDGNVLSSTDTNGDITLSPDGSGTVSVTTAPIVPSGDRADSLGSATNSWDNVYCDGLSFNDGTNIMGSYIESTWTPTIAFGGGTTGITYVSQTGIYTQIGRVVFIQCDITLSSKGSSTGAATLELPIATGSGQSSLLNMQCTTFAGLTLGGGYSVVSLALQTSSTTVNINKSDPAGSSGYANVTDAEFANSSVVRFSGFYFI